MSKYKLNIRNLYKKFISYVRTSLSAQTEDVKKHVDTPHVDTYEEMNHTEKTEEESESRLTIKRLGRPTTTQSLDSYLSYEDRFKIKVFGFKRLPKKECILLKKRIKDAKRRKALDDKFIDSHNLG